MNGSSSLRMATKKAGPVVTDQGNLILDVLFNNGIKNPREIEMSINNIPGVLENGLFVDLTDKVLVGKIDNNIPNGNSIFLLTLNKIFNITENNIYKNKIENLTKSFYSLIDRNYSQMFSYYKTLDICENNITFTFCGFNDEFQKIRDFLLLNYFEKSTFIYKKSNDEQYILICKNQTCSQKLKNISEILNIDENLIGIKATTNEKLGPEGREEGISCHSVVLLEKQ